MTENFKIAIPMAGRGTRMRPHTWSKPKPLIALAGKTVLDYVLEQFNTLPGIDRAEYIFIIGPQGDQIKSHMEKHHPEKVCHYVVQTEMRGQSEALYLAREYLKGPILMAFSDTLIETDLSFLKNETVDGVAWVKPVPDPRRFGVAEVNDQGFVTRLVEKPQDMRNNLAAVGFYYFRSGEALIEAIEEQMRRKAMFKNEYFLADAINIMLERGARFLTETVNVWLDAGVPEALLETNRYLLSKWFQDDPAKSRYSDVAIIPPVFIHPEAQITRSVIGPYVSIGGNCRIDSAIIRNSIIDEGTEVFQLILEDSLIGEEVHLESQAVHLNLGDGSRALR